MVISFKIDNHNNKLTFIDSQTHKNQMELQCFTYNYKENLLLNFIDQYFLLTQYTAISLLYIGMQHCRADQVNYKLLEATCTHCYHAKILIYRSFIQFKCCLMLQYCCKVLQASHVSQIDTQIHGRRMRGFVYLIIKFVGMQGIVLCNSIFSLGPLISSYLSYTSTTINYLFDFVLYLLFWFLVYNNN